MLFIIIPLIKVIRKRRIYIDKKEYIRLCLGGLYRR